MAAVAPAAPAPPAGAPLEATAAAADFLPGIALALALGLLIGVERGWRMRGEGDGARVAGIRTFSLLGLLGGLLGTRLLQPLGPVPAILAAGAVGALLLGYAGDMRRDHNVSATSALAAVLTLALGALAGAGQLALASVGAGVAVILLSSREALHRAIGLTSETDIRALLRLVLVVFVILPLLPDAPMGPYGALNPRRLWLVVVVTAGISFVGYALTRFLGQRRGALLTGAVGALVSSTAVTLDAARRMREAVAGTADHAAVAVAQAVMLGRALVLVAILAPAALVPVSGLLVPAAVAAVAAAAILIYRSRDARTAAAAPEAKPPGLKLAFLFAGSVAVISLASAWAERNVGSGGGALVIALGGTADIDAAIAAVGSLPPGTLPLREASLALAAPILFNTLFKLAILLGVAGPRRCVAAAFSLGLSALLLLAALVTALVGA